MAKKLVTLPKDFRTHGDAYSLTELQEIFQRRSLDARGGYSKQAALAYSTVDPEGVCWLLDQAQTSRPRAGSTPHPWSRVPRTGTPRWSGCSWSEERIRSEPEANTHH